jgi:hypothetical protein
MSVTNRDSADCETATFDLSASVPSGWAQSLSAATLSLAPAATGTVTLSVTAPIDASDGSYIVESTATQRSSWESATASATYTVNSPVDDSTANSAPVAVADSASTDKNTAVTISVLANDSDPDGDALSVAAVSQPASKGSVNINGDGTLYYQPHPRFTGTDTFSYTISDGSYQASAQVTVTVGGSSSGGDDSTTGGGKGKGPNK